MLDEHPILSSKHCIDETGNAIDRCIEYEPKETNLSVQIIGNGGVSSEDALIRCPDIICSASYFYNETIILIAVPNEFYRLKKWTGDCYKVTGDDTKCAVIMDSDKEIFAEFAPLPVLTVIVKNCGFVTTNDKYFECGIHSEGNPTGIGFGINCKTDCSEIYEYNKSVTLYAIGTECCSFDGADKWSGCTSCNSTSCTVIMIEDKTITATFTLWTYLTVKIKPNDIAGKVTSSDGKIDCVEDCIQCYHPNTTNIILTAHETNPVYEFDYWTKDSTKTCTDKILTCEILKIGDNNITIAAYFKLVPCLTVAISPEGSGTVISLDEIISCPFMCTECAKSNTVIDLTANPINSFYKFDKWSANVTTSFENTCTVKLVINITITAYFKLKPCITVTISPEGSGTITSNSEISCPGICTECVNNNNTVINLTAEPANNYEFDKWSTNVTTSSENTCTVKVTSKITIVAYFKGYKCLIVKSCPIGTASIIGNGINYPFDNIECDKLNTVFNLTTVSFYPTVFKFISWSGYNTATDGDSVSGNTCTINLKHVDKTIIASYKVINLYPIQIFYGEFCVLVETSPKQVGTIIGSGINYPTLNRGCCITDTTYTLTAQSTNSEYVFKSWSTNITTSSGNTCTVDIQPVYEFNYPATYTQIGYPCGRFNKLHDVTIIAYFTKTPCLIVKSDPELIGIIVDENNLINYPTDDSECSNTESIFNLTATPLDSTLYTFKSWSTNVDSKIDNTCVATLKTVDKTIIAYFTKTPCLIIKSSPNLIGIIVDENNLINYPSDNSECASNKTFKLTATSSSPLYIFDHWTGTVDSKNKNTCVATLKTVDKTITAVYIPNPYTLGCDVGVIFSNSGVIGCCKSRIISGGPGTTIHEFIFPENIAAININFEAYVEEDRITVYDDSDRILLLTNFLTNSNVFIVNIPIDINILKIKVYGPDPSTLWEYTIDCISGTRQSPRNLSCYSELTVKLLMFPDEVAVGTGPIVSSDQEINCPSICSQTVKNGVVFHLSASSTSKYTFDHWSENVDDFLENNCTITVISDITVIAYYKSVVCLIVATSPANIGIISGNGIDYPTDNSDCSVVGTEYSLTTLSNDESKYTFDHWSTNVTSSNLNTCIVTLNAAMTVVAYYKSVPPDPCLTVVTSPANVGTINNVDFTINYPTIPKLCVDIGTEFTLFTWVEDTEYSFVSWSTNVTGVTPYPADGASCTFTLNSGMTVVANYKKAKCFKLYISIVIYPTSPLFKFGKITSTPDGIFDSDPPTTNPIKTVCGTVTLHAESTDSGYAFYSWKPWTTGEVETFGDLTLDMSEKDQKWYCIFKTGYTPPVEPTTGTKYAVVVGINAYVGGISPLQGCVPDAKTFRDTILPSCGFKATNITTLLDSSASRTNIMNALTKMVSKSVSGDTIFFSYSGHGAQVTAISADTVESDGLDEIICHWATSKAAMLADPIRDQHIGGALKIAPAGVKIVVVLDSCYSGTGVREISPLTKEKYIEPPEEFKIKSNVKFINTISRAVVNVETGQGDIILISGCSDTQTSADFTTPTGAHAGALTYCIFEVLKNHSYIVSYNTLITEVCAMMPTLFDGSDQIPQLEGKSSLLTGNFLA